MRALITGIGGQDGSYLAELLLNKGYEVHGLVRGSTTEPMSRLEGFRDRLVLHSGDLQDQHSLEDVLRECEPVEVYHLAGTSFVAESWSQPVLTAEFTAVGTARMLEAVRQVTPDTRFYQASSSEMFGKPEEVPQRETHALQPAQSLRNGEVLLALRNRQLPRGLRPVRRLGDPLQPRVAAPSARVRDPEGDPREPPPSGPGTRPSWCSAT